MIVNISREHLPLAAVTGFPATNAHEQTREFIFVYL